MDPEPLTPAYDTFVEEVPGRLHGRQLATPIYAATKHSIRNKLHGNRPVRATGKRNALIIQRANWVTQLKLRVPSVNFDVEAFMGAVCHARRHEDHHLDINLAPDYMPPMDWLQETFPSDDESQQEVIEQHRRKININNMYEHRGPMDLFNRPMAHLRDQAILGALEVALKTVVQDTKVGKISKMVVFGDHGVLYWDDKWNPLGPERRPKISEFNCFHRASMWSSLFLMRDTLFEQGAMTTSTPIYVQDTGFRSAELENFERWGVTVLCGAYGHQQGFVEIDRETMVVLFCQHVNILALILEITDPALVFVNEHLQSQMGPLGQDTEAPGYWLGDYADMDVPSGNIPLNYRRFFREYAEVPLTDVTTQDRLPQVQPSSRFFVRKSK